MLFVLPLASSFARAAPPQIKILAFGDSLTAGYRLSASEAYPALIQTRLRELGLDATVVNAGVSGDTTGQGLRRVAWNLKQGPFDVVLVGLGANDGLRNLPLEDLEANLGQIIQRFRDSGAQIILLGMKLPTNMGAAYRRDFEAIYPRVAKKFKIPELPFLLEGVAAQQKLNLEDQVHPNAAGHRVVAQNILRVLEPMVQSLAQNSTPKKVSKSGSAPANRLRK